MGANLETVKDSEGNSHLIFDESSVYDDNKMGEKLSDFEILKVLSSNEEGEDDEEEVEDEKKCLVTKVRSLINHKIYAMKKIDKLNPKEKEEYLNRIAKIKNMQHPHIIKYHKVIEEGDSLYLIMEFMNNSDIKGYIKAHQILNKDIKEEEIWNILLQCISGVEYLHKYKDYSPDIKINDIYMNNEQNAKISIYTDPNPKESNNKTSDIPYLGKYFYCMCFSQEDRIKTAKNYNEVYMERKNTNYSTDLMKIIYEMGDMNDNLGPNLNKLSNDIKKKYVEKYKKNTSIESVLRCLYSYPSLNKEIKVRKDDFLYNKEIYYICNWYYTVIQALSGIQEVNLYECIEEFRRAIASENSKLDESKEIDPIYLLAFLLEKIHKELNKADFTSLEKDQVGKYVISSVFNGEEEDKTNKDQMLKKFITSLGSKVNSPISNLFFGIMKTKINCKTCLSPKYSFSSFCFVIFDLSEKNGAKFNLIEDGFKAQHNNGKHIEPDSSDRIYCERCLTYQRHVEFNRYYKMGSQLVICFIRGTNYKNNTDIEFNENMDLKDYIEDPTSTRKFVLVGAITRYKEKDEYLSFSRDIDNFTIWHIGGENNNFDKAPINLIKQKQIIMLFYDDEKHYSK